MICNALFSVSLSPFNKKHLTPTSSDERRNKKKPRPLPEEPMRNHIEHMRRYSGGSSESSMTSMGSDIRNTHTPSPRRTPVPYVRIKRACSLKPSVYLSCVIFNRVR